MKWQLVAVIGASGIIIFPMLRWAYRKISNRFALKRREIIHNAAQREAEAVDADLRELERLKKLAEKHGLTVTLQEQGESKQRRAAPENAKKPEQLEKGVNYLKAIAAAEAVIRSEGRPVELKVIYDRIHDAVDLSGEKPRNVLSAYLSHQKSTLQSVRKGWWWLKDTPIPPDDLQENQGPVNVGVFS